MRAFGNTVYHTRPTPPSAFGAKRPPFAATGHGYRVRIKEIDVVYCFRFRFLKCETPCSESQRERKREREREREQAALDGAVIYMKGNFTAGSALGKIGLGTRMSRS
jgi:hypothetical protein